MPPEKVDAVFEGGGVKGVGLVGAVSVVEEAGYEFVRLAGTSAGAIVAALLAAGYNAAELKKIITELDLMKLEDPTVFMRIPIAGPLISELVKDGLYKGDVFETKMREWLAAKGKHTFKDLLMTDKSASEDRYRFKLRVIATDISQRRMVVLPQDIIHYGKNPEDLDIAKAVRMSMSLPLFFEPVKLNGSDIVDGGVVSNFPVDLFDSSGPPDWPTFGFKLVLSDQHQPGQLIEHPINGPLSEMVALFYTAMEAQDAYHLASSKYVRTIDIDTLNIGTTDFNLTAQQKEALYQSGVKAAQEFLKTWDFNKYKAQYRSGQPSPSRHELLL